MTVPVSSGAISHEELMKSDYIQLEWNSPVWDILPAGAFIEYEGEKYSLLEPYQPICTSEAEYQYTPQFQSRIMAWDKHPVPLYTYDEDGSVVGREFDWEFTGSPADVLYMVKQAIVHETGEEWTYQLSDSLPATVSLQSQSSSIFSVLSELADLCETEWWVDKKNNFLHLSKCEYGEPVMLTAGQNVKMPSITNSKDGYYTRFYVFGSTKNITQDYQSGQATNHIVNKRLTLDPLKYPGGFKDIKGHFENGVFVSDLLQGEIFPKTLYFDEVFPSSRLTISNVRPRAKYRLDSHGNKIQIGGSEDEPVYEQYAIWYFRVEGFDFDPQTIIEGTKLSVSFESGQLAGRDFELIYHEKDQTVKDAADVTAFDEKAGDYEIIIDESTGSIIPGAVYIIPQDGDNIVLYNIEMPDEYTTSAQVELEAEIDKEIARRIADNNTYEFDSNPVDFYNQGMDVVVGQSVHFSFDGSTLETRVLMVEKRLDGIYQQRIRIGNEQIKGVTQELKEDVADANQSIDVIKAFNELSSALSNAYANAQREMIEGFAAIKNMWQFDKENENTIFSAFNVYSKGWMSAKGIDKGEEGSGAGSTTIGGLTNVGSWADQTADYDRIMVQLSGSNTWTEKRLDEIGGGLDEEQLAAYLTENNYAKIADIPSLDGYATQSWVLGNGYATTSDLDSRIDALVNGAPAAFDTLKEIADVLQGNVDSIGDILTTLGTKADKSISILAGTGLAGGGTLSANRTLSLKPATTSALGGIIVGDRLSIDSSGRLTATYTYTHPSATATTITAATGKVLSAITVNSLGHVTSVAAKTLAAADIPSLAISKITGLQAELDKKLDKSVLDDLFEKVEIREGVYAIRAKYGLFTNGFLSAKGMDEGSESPGGGATKLSELTDVSLTNLKDNDLLRWNGTRWVNVPQSSISPSLAWENITGKPSTFPPSAHTHTKSQITDFPATWAWGAISGKPTTLSGYGITDGVNDVTVSGSGNAVTGASISGHKLTLTKGSTFLLSSAYTANDILTKLKTVDGAGSGLDADTLDGYHGSSNATGSTYVLRTSTGGIITKSVEYKSNYYATPKSAGWYRFFKFAGSNANGASAIIHIDRLFYSPSNESYTFAINVSFGTGISITQLSGFANSRLITKIRVNYVNSGDMYVDFYYDSTSHFSNIVYCYGSGRGNFQTPELVSTSTGNNCEFKTGNGFVCNEGINGVDMSRFFYGKGNKPSGLMSSVTGSGCYSTVSSLPDDAPDGAYGYGNFVIFDAGGSSANGGAITQIYFPHRNESPYYRTTYGRNAGTYIGWYKLARTTDNVASASKLETAHTINGTSFDGTANITTSNWGTARSVGIVNSDGTGTAVTVSVNGGANVNLKLPATIKAALTGNATTATTLQTARTIWGQSFNGSANVSGALTGVTNITASGSVTAQMVYIKGTANSNAYIKADTAYDMYFSCNSISLLNLDGSQKAVRSGSGYNGQISLGTSSVRWASLYAITGNFSGNILATGSITAKAVSDLRLKTILTTTADYRHKLLSLGRVVDFYYNDKAIQRNTGAVDRERHTGLVYQSAKEIGLPNFCHTDDDGYGAINYLCTDYINLIAGALQQTIVAQETIEQRVDRLERENEELKRQLNNLTAA